jgi:hypothetical protein
MQGERDGEPRGRLCAGAVGEWLLITAVFAAAGAWPVPDVNEAHYLTKARHAFDPSWCMGDFFLDSRGAHGLFFQLLGPLAGTLPLATAAWLGRWAGWLLLAAGFRHAVRPLLATAGQRLVAAALFSLAVRSTTMAGEWLIGGCEAKVFAWAAVLAAWGELAAGRWSLGWLGGGLAAAFHPLVGGWMMIVTLVAALCDRLLGRSRRIENARVGAVEWAEVSAGSISCVVGGLAAAAVGFVPAVMLTAGVPAEVQAEAARVYVVDRLPHHLLPRTFHEGFISRHLLAIGLWAVVTAGLPASAVQRRITVVTLAAVGCSGLGWLIGLSEATAPDSAYQLLRYYWFRLGDVLVPLSLAAVTVAALWPAPLSAGATEAAAGRLPDHYRRGLRWSVLGLLLLDLVAQSGHWPLPGRQRTARGDKHVAAAAWQDVCEWIRANTPPTAQFLTPRGAASFSWRAERPEVVSWKNIPQDPAGIVAWRQRILDCFSPDGSLRGMARSTVSLGQQRLEGVARRYRASYIVAPQASVAEAGLPLRPVYANDGYVVLQLSSRDEGKATDAPAASSSGPGDAEPPALDVERLGK